jgi:hypothetical protein
VRRVRVALLWIAASVTVSGCGPAGASLDPPTDAVSIQPSPTPFSRVSAGEVTALVPDGWAAQALSGTSDHRGGFVASPRPEAWSEPDGKVDGLSASWVDASAVGVPSDYYYLAARGPLLSRLISSPHCHATRQQVLLDRRPILSPESGPGPADYVARGHGVCRIDRERVRWAYFVAAPGYGPVREMGISSSGLYVVVAVVHAPSADVLAQRLVMQATFGGSSVRDIVAASRGLSVG